MPYNATPSDGFVHVEWFGVPETADLQLLHHDLAKIGAMLGYAPSVLHTFSRVKSGAITPWSLLQHALCRRDVPLPNPVRIAWVTTKAEVRRMGELFAELNRNPRIEIAVFGNSVPAKAWLRARATGTSPAKGAAAG